MNDTEMNASGCYVKADLSASGLPPYGNTINMPDVKDLDTKVYERNQEPQALDQPQLPFWEDNQMAYYLPRRNPGNLQSISYGSATEMNASAPCYVKTDLSASGLPPYGNTILPEVKYLDTLVKKVYGRNQEPPTPDQP